MKRLSLPADKPAGENSRPGGSILDSVSSGIAAAAAVASTSPPNTFDGVWRRGVPALAGALDAPEISIGPNCPGMSRSGQDVTVALFDCIVVVDWSASAVPRLRADSVWSHVLDVPTGRGDTINHPTRQAAADHVREVLVGNPGRVLVGCDFSYGYPVGFASATGLVDPSSPGRPAWRVTWDHLTAAILDGPDNANNRFAVAASLNAGIGEGPGPFWGTTSVRHVAPTLSRTKAPGFPHVGRTGVLAEHRTAERRLRADGAHPSSTWQLAGIGSVGSQSLTGIPVVARWRDDPALADRSVVWPFETGITADPTLGRDDTIVHAEVWPSSIAVDLTRHDVKDAAQVICLAEHLAALDAAGLLGRCFAPPLTDDELAAVLDEEGWIVGA
jgi:hypothetical protein